MIYVSRRAELLARNDSNWNILAAYLCFGKTPARETVGLNKAHALFGASDMIPYC
jgi:hypothetical protein